MVKRLFHKQQNTGSIPVAATFSEPRKSLTLFVNVNWRIMSKTPGYCALCRAKELELYGKVLHNAGTKHANACKEAGCKHPTFYKMK